MSTSTDGAMVLRGLPVDAFTAADTSTDLRGGIWTRFGNDAVRGDAATEATLRGLAEQSREAARAQGFAAGWAEGRRGSLARSNEAQEESARRFDEQGAHLVAAQKSAADALVTAATRLEETARALHATMSDQAVELALQIAEAVLGRELRALDDPAAEALGRALAEVPVDVPVTVHLHPADLATLDRSLVADRVVTFTTDPSVPRGDALAETESGIVDAGLTTALARVREVLGR